MICEKCPYWYSDCNELGDSVRYTCHYEGEVAPCEEDNMDGPRYTISYDEPLFEGDERNGYHGFDCDDWEDVRDVLNHYGKDVRITVHDNYYGCTYDSLEGEWN